MTRTTIIAFILSIQAELENTPWWRYFKRRRLKKGLDTYLDSLDVVGKQRLFEIGFKGRLNVIDAN